MFKKLWVVAVIFPEFLKLLFTRRGFFSAEGRQLIWGKSRRTWLSVFPFVARKLQKHYGLEGSCESCGASCKMMFQCPHWDESSHLCSVYEYRPSICKTFPITPGDISDRNLVLKDTPCGFTFTKK